MRLFIATDFKPEFFKKIQDKIDESLFKGRLASSFHITYNFLGETDKVEKIKERLGKVRFDKFSIDVSNIGVFPNEKNIRVIWAGIKEDKEVIELQKKIDDSLGGLFPGNERFKAHITLARVRLAKEELMSSLRKIPVEKRFKVNKFQLIQSTLTREGPVYDVIEEYIAL